VASAALALELSGRKEDFDAAETTVLTLNAELHRLLTTLREETLETSQTSL